MTLPLGFAVRQAAGADDFAFIIALLRKEQWNPGTRDADLFRRIDPAVSYAQDDETPPSFAFIGLYIVVTEHRGKGFGMALWKRAMSRLAQPRTIGLDAVAAQVPNYRQSGFVIAYRDLRYMGLESPSIEPLLDPTTATLVSLDQVPIDDLVAFDARYFSVPRKRFLETWAEQRPGMHGVALLDVASGSGRAIRAYGVIRQSAAGHRVGPLFAQDSNSARLVLVKLVQLAHTVAAASSSGSIRDVSSCRVFLDVPDLNAAAATLMQGLGMKVVSECARMYHGPAPDVQLEGIFATTTDI
ncbi:hypothetical protein HDU86_006495 [Geranomyces michiganensis]|nr:hypothetical protein HDU86_006495 [Geranomyces michiganensis]